MWSPPVIKSRLSVLLLCLWAWSCDTGAAPQDSTGPLPVPSSQGEEVSRAELSSARRAVEITNMDDVGRHYLLFEADLSAVVDPNLDPAFSDQWIGLAPGTSIQVELEDVTGWHEGAMAIVVYSWTESVAHPVAGAVQWLAEGWYTMRVDL